MVKRPSTDEILSRARREASLNGIPPEVVEFKKAGGRAHFDKTTGYSDIEINRWRSDPNWFPSLVRLLGKIRIRCLSMRGSQECVNQLLDGLSAGTVLHALDLHGSLLTDAGLTQLPEFQQLESLNLADTKITDRSLVACSELPLLSALSLAGTAISDRGIQSLGFMPAIRRLDISSTHVSDESIPSLQRLGSLESLILNGTLVTDSAIDPLATFPILNSIALTGSLVSREGVDRLIHLRPDAEICWSRSLNQMGYWCQDVEALRQAMTNDDETNRVVVEDVAEINPIHPRRFVNPSWEKDLRRKIIRYLKEAPIVRQYCGLSYCRFGCGWNGSREHSDGVWLWPEGLSHYVELHDVMLPEPFVIHVKDHEFAIPVSEDANMGFPASTSVWRQWCYRHLRCEARRLCESD